MELDQVVTRLKAELVGIKAIGIAADMDAAINGVVPLPAAFVVPLAEAPESDLETTGGVEQTIWRSFGVIHVVNNARDARGGAALSDLAPLRSNLRAALLGWGLDPADGEPILFQGGRLLSMDKSSRLWWIDEFRVKTEYWSN